MRQEEYSRKGNMVWKAGQQTDGRRGEGQYSQERGKMETRQFEPIVEMTVISPHW